MILNLAVFLLVVQGVDWKFKLTKAQHYLQHLRADTRLSSPIITEPRPTKRPNPETDRASSNSTSDPINWSSPTQNRLSLTKRPGPTPTLRPASSNRSTSWAWKSYMLTLRIPEQLTMSTAHFHQFLNLVNDWNFTGVEPFAYNSEPTLFGLRSLRPNNLPFSKLFNTTMHNSFLSECMKRDHTPEAPFLFETMREFIRHSYRKLVLVHYDGHHQEREIVPKNVYEKMEFNMRKETKLYSDCSSAAQTSGLFDHVEHIFSKEVELEKSTSNSTFPDSLGNHSTLTTFKVVQAFCIKRNIKMSLRDLKSFIFDHIKQDVDFEAQNMYDHGISIVFLTWQGRFTHPLVDSDVKGYINNCRIPFSRPFHSNYVVDLAQKYLESQLSYPGKPYLSVHIRLEKLMYYVLNHKLSLNEYLDCCMKRAKKLISFVRTNFSIEEGNILLNWDYSPYGSKECPIPNCGNVANEHIKKLSIQPSYFKPERFGIARHNVGLFSLVEMHALIGGSALVTVGEGSYQYTIIQSFIEHHRHGDTNLEAVEKLHYGHLCIPPEELHELSKTDDLAQC